MGDGYRVDDKSTRYVAQENIEVVTDLDDPPAEMLPWVGRWFKRWDREKKAFVSNLKEEYPDD